MFNGAQILIETWLHVNKVLRCKWRCGSSKWTSLVDEVQVFLLFLFALEPVQDLSALESAVHLLWNLMLVDEDSSLPRPSKVSFGPSAR